MSSPTAEEIFRRLVSFDTTSAKSNLELADFVCNLLESRAPEIVRDASEEGDKANLLIRVGPEQGEDRRGLVLSGHMDTVPAVEPAWKSDPFVLTDAGDRWIARGASDMKGFLSLAISLAMDLELDQLSAPLYLLLSYDEEVGTLGAKHWIDHHGAIPLSRATIIGEPTQLRVVRMHKGHLKLMISVRGVSAHSGYPHLGVNAIERSGSIIDALGDLRIELEGERTDDSDFFEPVPWVPLNIGEIHGGTAINIVPDLCRISIGLRLLPGMESESIIERISTRVQSVVRDPGSVELSLINESPPMKLDAFAPIVRELASLTGETQTRAVSFATDAGWFQSLGLDCVLFGPGSIEVAHKPNEFIPKEQFHRARELLDQAIRRFCIEARP